MSEPANRPAPENPFGLARVSDLQDFRPDWDVASLNAKISETLAAEIAGLIGQRAPDRAQRYPILVAPQGYGKTHLLARVAHQLGDRALIIFVDAAPDSTRTLEHIRWNAVETLFRARRGAATFIASALASLFHSSILEFLKDSPAVETEHAESFLRSIQAGSDAVLEIAQEDCSMSPFFQLADAVAANIPDAPAPVLKALPWGGPRRLTSHADGSAAKRCRPRPRTWLS